MKKKLSLVFVLLSALSVLAQKEKGFIIEGELDGLKDGTALNLIHNKDGKADTVATTVSKNEKFVFKGRLPVEGEVYFIKVDTVTMKYDYIVKGYLKIMMENTIIHVKGSLLEDLEDPRTAITGPASHYDFIDFFLRQEAINRTSDLFRAIWDTKYADQLKKLTRIDSLDRQIVGEKLDKGLREWKEMKDQWILQHPNSLFVPWVISNTGDIVKEESYYNELPDRVKNSKYGIDLKKKIERVKRTSIGQIAPDFTLPTPEGKLLSLKEVAGQGKVTLLDFWASWCFPCRREFKLHTKRLYDLYYKKGFNVLGYSIDENEKAWKDAIVNDSLPWQNIREATGEIARSKYGIQSVPMTYLLDSKGRIIGKSLHGKDLEKKLEELLGKENN